MYICYYQNNKLKSFMNYSRFMITMFIVLQSLILRIKALMIFKLDHLSRKKPVTLLLLES